MRSDLRDDRGAEAEHRARNEIVETLRGEVARLSATVANMSVEIGRERAARREAEERAINAERQVAALLERVQTLERSIQTTR